MSWHNKVVWTEGMFLQPQHFQQHDRFLANQMQAKVASMSPYHWGFADLQIDEAALAMGKLALVSARGVLPDGTAFSMPIEDAVPAALDIGADVRNEVVVLAVVLPRPGVVETDAEEAGGSTPPPACGRGGCGRQQRHGRPHGRGPDRPPERPPDAGPRCR